MDITVSIIMLVYNHERFLSQALDSVLMQKVNFDYELIVGEDCSLDKSREILKSYEEKFGKSLVPLYREKNLGMNRNMEDCLKHCRGKYVAFLEGDDFWLDPCKLQKQVDFLEQHPDYAAVYSSYTKVDIQGNFQSQEQIWQDFHEYTQEDFEQFLIPGQTGTMMLAVKNAENQFNDFRKVALRYAWIPGDRLCLIPFLKIGRIGVLPDCMSAYRYYREENGTNWSSKHEGNVKNMLLYYYVLQVGCEKCARKMGLPYDLYENRLTYFGRLKAFRQMGIIGPRREWLLSVLMMLVEPHKLRLFSDRNKLKQIP